MLLKQVVIVSAVTLALAACNKDKSAAPTETDQPPPATTADADDKSADDDADAPRSGKAEATKVFNERCAVCHGVTGKGDGPGSVALDPKPRAFGDPAWQAKITDEQIKKVILHGGMAVGLSAVMPASPELRKKPWVVDALVAKVRSFKD